MMWYLGILDRDLVPDWVIRRAIRQRCQRRLDKEAGDSSQEATAKVAAFVEELKTMPIALHTDDANEQHYELPPEFFTTVLGPHLKYSCGYWPEGVTTLAESEERMLALTVERAGVTDGMQVLDLGCGWGSLSLYMAEKFPGAQFTAVSNSGPQGDFIRARAAERGLTNLKVLTADMNTFTPDEKFDRVVSIEMFEHMKNYQELLKRIASWLKPEGALFVHIFVHARLAYHYESEGPDDWMARYFFTGGTMPSDDLLSRFDQDLKVAQSWQVPGEHYQKTCEAWLTRMDDQRNQVREILAGTYGADQVTRWWVRWRIFFMACAELFGYRGGREWFVGHYLLKR
jgi:cyclopropane-fatty-acyl-phospholipid synthase|nr:cyclopropane-fatty-acyl-phospholipid synthase family protein [Candidatus Krumholzibacteria bacterium]